MASQRRPFIAIRMEGVYRQAGFVARALSEQHVGTVAEWRVTRILAATKKGKLTPLGGEHEGLDAGSRMRAVAEGLLLASTAAAPSVALAGFELDLIGAEL